MVRKQVEMRIVRPRHGCEIDIKMNVREHVLF